MPTCTLLADIDKYQTLGTIFICGDFNGRCGNLEDFISGVVDIEHRNVVDFKTNLYGEILNEYLINSNMCILNGRNFIKNDFTSVSVKGYAVVDYCLVNHENLSSFQDFDVIRTVDLISRLPDLSSTAPVSFPDHSVIAWKIDCGSFDDTSHRTTIHQCAIHLISSMFPPSLALF